MSQATEKQISELGKIVEKLAPTDYERSRWAEGTLLGGSGLMAVAAAAIMYTTTPVGWIAATATAIASGVAWYNGIGAVDQTIKERGHELFTSGGKNTFVNKSFYELISSFIVLDENSPDKTDRLANDLLEAAKQYVYNDSFVGFSPFDPDLSSNKVQILEDIEKDSPSGFMLGLALDIARKEKEIVFAKKLSNITLNSLGAANKAFDHSIVSTAEFTKRRVRRKVYKKITDEIQKGEASSLIKNKLIATIIKNGYRLSDLNVKVGEHLDARMQNKYDLRIELPANLSLKGVSSRKYEKDGSQSANPSATKIDNDLANRDGKLYDENSQKGVWKTVINKDHNGKTYKEEIFGGTIEWPAVISDQEGYEELIKDFDLFKGVTLSSYDFKSKISFTGESVVGLLTSWVGNWIDDEPEYKVDQRDPSAFIEFTMQEQYFLFLEDVLSDLSDDNKIDETVGTKFAKLYDPVKSKKFLDTIMTVFVMDKELVRRIELFKFLETIDKDEDIDPEELKKAEKKAIDAWKTGEFTDTVSTLSDEEIEGRQKFFKQCALMLNMKKCSDKFKEEVASRNYTIPFDGRFYTMRCMSNQETLISKLVSSKHEQTFFELKPHEVSKLTPKIRLFKVFEDGEGKTKEIEFSFERTSDVNTKKYMSAEIDKGSGVGLKEFSFEFNGTNPAEARNDIQASLKLYFQSFTDFTKVRKATNGSYRYADLVIQPTKDDNKPYGVSLQSGRHYDPMFYRIRVEVGYYIPDGASKELTMAINSSNKSFFLTMVDHSLDFAADGSATMSISYRAYMESLLQHPRLDALSTPELIEKREENQRLFLEQIQKKECSVEQIRELQISLQAQEEVIIKQSLSSIIKRLAERGAIYYASIDESDRQFFAKNGFFNTCDLTFGNKSNDDGTVLEVLNSQLPEKSDDFNFIDSKSTSVSFFYFGDLLYTVLDCVFLEGSTPRYGMQNNKFILGSFDFQSFSKSDRSSRVYNISEMPISVDFFSRWFVDNITSQKDTRKSFPLLRFVRTLSDQLIRKSLIENCVNRNLSKALRFQTGQITAYDPKSDPLIELAKSSLKLYPETDSFSINVDGHRRLKKTLPLNGGGSSDSTKVDDYYNYIVLATVGSSLSFVGRGDYKEDIKDSRFHVHVGKDSGIVKTISLSKSDQQYIREARFFQNGIDGLLQLSSVYVATLEMFGNTIFYPGMEFFFNPYGLGGSTEFGSPTEKQSMANKLGIGGYHTVTSVKSSITPGKFTTTVSGQQYYSGAIEDNQGHSVQKKLKGANLEEYQADNENIDACNSTILEVQNYDFEELAAPSESTIEEPIEEEGSPGSSVPDFQTVSTVGDVELVKTIKPTVFTIDGENVTGTLEEYSDGTAFLTYLDIDDSGIEVTVEVTDNPGYTSRR